MNPDKRIFTENFKGSIDDLLNFASANADNVEDILDGRKDMFLTDDEARTIIKQDYPELSAEEIDYVIHELKLEEAQRHFDKLTELGLIEIQGYEDGEAIYGLTPLGEEYYQKNVKNKKKDIPE